MIMVPPGQCRKEYRMVPRRWQNNAGSSTEEMRLVVTTEKRKELVPATSKAL